MAVTSPFPHLILPSQVLHSSAYKDKSQLKGKRVLVVGSQVISRGVHYHHFHDSQRLLMLSPG